VRDSGQRKLTYSSQNHCTSTLRSGRRKTIVSQTMCAPAERLSQSEIVLPLRKTCYYSPLAEVGVFSTEINRTGILQKMRDDALTSTRIFVFVRFSYICPLFQKSHIFDHFYKRTLFIILTYSLNMHCQISDLQFFQRFTKRMAQMITDSRCQLI